MSTSPEQGSLASRSLSVLRNMGAWVAINPDQTYVATSIPGLGACKSTYCQPQRRALPEAPAKAEKPRGLAPLLAVAMVALGLLAGCAGYPLVAARDVSDRGQNARQNGRDLADCQIYAEPVSPGASAGRGDLPGGLTGADAAGDHHFGAEGERFLAVERGVTGAAGTQVRAVGSCLSGGTISS